MRIVTSGRSDGEFSLALRAHGGISAQRGNFAHHDCLGTRFDDGATVIGFVSQPDDAPSVILQLVAPFRRLTLVASGCRQANHPSGAR